MIAIILARGGSKGVPGKNIKELNRIPLLAYPIIAAKNAKNISNVYVSTDDKIIRKVALDYKAKVIDRPEKLAQDNSLDIDAMKHAVNYLNYSGNIVHLRATTPMIESSILDDAIEYFLANNKCTALRSAHESSESAYKLFKQTNEYWSGLFDDTFEGDYYNWPRQKLPKTYQPNGYIDILKTNWFMDNNSLHGNKILSYITDYAHEVDTQDDLKILRALYDKN